MTYIEIYNVDDIKADNKKKLDVCGIYCISNNVNGKKYIGQSINIYDRWVSHILSLKGHYHHNQHLQASWDKYSQEAFCFYILEKCDENSLWEREQYWINKFNTLNANYGYNLIPAQKGIKLSYNKWRKQRIPIFNEEWKVCQFDLEGNFVAEYNSALEAGRKINRTLGYSGAINSVLQTFHQFCLDNFSKNPYEKNKPHDYLTAYGYVWVRKSDAHHVTPERIKEFIRPNREFLIHAYSYPYGKYLATYRSMAEAANAYGTTRDNVWHCMDRHCFQANNITFRRASECEPTNLPLSELPETLYGYNAIIGEDVRTHELTVYHSPKATLVHRGEPSKIKLACDNQSIVQLGKWWYWFRDLEDEEKEYIHQEICNGNIEYIEGIFNYNTPEYRGRNLRLSPAKGAPKFAINPSTNQIEFVCETFNEVMQALSINEKEAKNVRNYCYSNSDIPYHNYIWRYYTNLTDEQKQEALKIVIDERTYGINCFPYSNISMLDNYQKYFGEELVC